MRKVVSLPALGLAALLVSGTAVQAQSICEFTGKFPPSCGSGGSVTQVTPPEVPAVVTMQIDPAQATPEALLPAYRRAFAQSNCQFPLDDGEAIFADALGRVLSVPGEQLLNRDGPWHHPIDQAFDRFADDGLIQMDRSANVIRMPSCQS
ncbi:hypothetical protein [Pararhodobacter sp. CCB-MM2]|uniref:hypothetical protein n=1 Tax=Pararhodobacter sp. CCB-MM2 TaxID=1786003 RepID=UPI000834D20F|nr:hypothetical protein [Pararhodobacter sp. CCB-MM2]